jgi:V/A-type H+-transporting ATPase subunit A
MLLGIMASRFSFPDKNEARGWFNRLRQRFLDYNGSEWQGDRFKTLEKEIRDEVSAKAEGLDPAGQKIIA